LKRATLKLCALTTTLLGQHSPNSYFLRRDFFPTLSKLLLDPQMANQADLVLLVLGNLSNYHKFEGRNLALQRLEDLVDDVVQRSLLDTVLKSIERCQR
jgi:hypothetical protein